MKTLADFKRALTIGSKWEAYHVLYGSNMGVREVSKVQSEAVAFKTETGTNSWLYFPKASNVKFNGTTVEIYNIDNNLMLTYKQV